MRSYWGWGAEDDDLYQRVKSRNLTVTYHEPQSEARYTMLYHQEAEANPVRVNILDDASHRFDKDGLVNLQYRRLDLQLKPLYTYIIVDIQPDSNGQTCPVIENNNNNKSYRLSVSLVTIVLSLVFLSL